MAETTVVVTGLDVLERALRVLPEKEERRILLKAARKGAVVLLEEEQDLVPKDSGALHDTLVIQRLKKKTGMVGYAVGVDTTQKAARVAHLVEFGTAAHTIRIKNKKFLTLGNAFFGVEVKIPAQPARSFIRAAGDNVFEDVVEAVGDSIGIDITQEYGE